MIKMSLEQKPFTKYNLDEISDKPDTFTIRLNKDERSILNECKSIIEQPKDSTALKTLALIGYKCITSEETKYIINVLFKNKRNNDRLGIAEFELK